MSVKWNNAEETLPEKYECVLACYFQCETANQTRLSYAVLYHNGEEWDKTNLFWAGKIIAWARFNEHSLTNDEADAIARLI